MSSRTTPAPVTFSDIDRLPMTLGADQVMGIYLKGSYAALLRDVHLGHVPPPRFTRPMRWDKRVIKKHYEGRERTKTSRRPA